MACMQLDEKGKGNGKGGRKKTRRRDKGTEPDLQDGYVCADPDIVSNGNRLADAVPQEAFVEPHGVYNFSPI